MRETVVVRPMTVAWRSVSAARGETNEGGNDNDDDEIARDPCAAPTLTYEAYYATSPPP